MVLITLTTLLFVLPVAALEPETCMAKRGVTVEHHGKRYTLRDEACSELFLSDPERYAQLFDALQELENAGRKPPARRSASLVPS